MDLEHLTDSAERASAADGLLELAHEIVEAARRQPKARKTGGAEYWKEVSCADENYLVGVRETGAWYAGWCYSLTIANDAAFSGGVLSFTYWRDGAFRAAAVAGGAFAGLVLDIRLGTPFPYLALLGGAAVGVAVSQVSRGRQPRLVMDGASLCSEEPSSERMRKARQTLIAVRHGLAQEEQANHYA